MAGTIDIQAFRERPWLWDFDPVKFASQAATLSAAEILAQANNAMDRLICPPMMMRAENGSVKIVAPPKTARNKRRAAARYRARELRRQTGASALAHSEQAPPALPSSGTPAGPSIFDGLPKRPAGPHVFEFSTKLPPVSWRLVTKIVPPQPEIVEVDWSEWARGDDAS